MGKLYFVRHGESEWNVQKKICGQTDVPLTDKGREQARMSGAKIIERGIKADEIWCSPLQRARETAEIIAGITGLPVRVEPRLIEQNFGSYEGKRFDTQDFFESKQRFADDYGGGESMLRVAQRIYNVIDDVKASGKTIILAAHNGIVRSVQSYFYSETNEEYAGFGIPNCEVVEYSWEDCGASIYT